MGIWKFGLKSWAKSGRNGTKFWVKGLLAFSGLFKVVSVRDLGFLFWDIFGYFLKTFGPQFLSFCIFFLVSLFFDRSIGDHICTIDLKFYKFIFFKLSSKINQILKKKLKKYLFWLAPKNFTTSNLIEIFLKFAQYPSKTTSQISKITFW